MPIIEDFDLSYEHFFDEPSYQVRWTRLKEIYAENYPSFRVLFVVETMGVLDTWREPTREELNGLLRHKMAGGQIAVRIGIPTGSGYAASIVHCYCIRDRSRVVRAAIGVNT